MTALPMKHIYNKKKQQPTRVKNLCYCLKNEQKQHFWTISWIVSLLFFRSPAKKLFQCSQLLQHEEQTFWYRFVSEIILQMMIWVTWRFASEISVLTCLSPLNHRLFNHDVAISPYTWSCQNQVIRYREKVPSVIKI
jgi:hypothetical protein